VTISSLQLPEAGLIGTLPRRDRAALLRCCEVVEVATATVLCEPGEPMRHVYFPQAAIISLVTMLGEGAQLEVAVIGDEGVLGAELLLGVTSSAQHAQVQCGGTTLRLTTAAYLRQCRQIAALRRSCALYVSVLMRQLALAVACTHYHLIEARLARRLLVMRDRARSNEFHITHEYLAGRLGVRRVGVTTAADSLHDRGLIEYRRGDIVITDGAGLELAACRCYRTANNMYGEIMGRQLAPLQGR
jgi:CRP-like cAMP-binding protein